MPGAADVILRQNAHGLPSGETPVCYRRPDEHQDAQGVPRQTDGTSIFFFDNRQAGDNMQRINDNQRVEDFLTNS
ncbi:hypothetical protein KUH03_31205 [Sphingobacterium sp. E70]|uniref:hypothetical protein n=1 Tax=Sphingobacterium sp. E70 TaxID=2853439 RepID=UPI00211C2ECE|nr:hypothetical protein [Sphingobacterium sp. E70]ULT23604.1 hypothetical protein KUH03_31205 [Sphingobacterium sp. E70]